MIAFILTAGLGTRLKPLTDHCPKALVPYQGKPLLAHLLERMQAFGIRHFVLNLHHFADKLQAYAADYAKAHGLQIDFSDERALLLDTGGALTHALPLFDGEERILVHNVDIFSDLDLNAFVRDAERLNADALLSVRQRQTSRFLYADADGRLRAWKNLKSGETKGEAIQCRFKALAFSGIHVMKTSLIRQWTAQYGSNTPFSVIDAYLNAIPFADIRLLEQQGGFWKDMGKMEDFNLPLFTV